MKTVLLLCALVVGSGTMWGDSYTITFANNASSATALTSSTNASTVISSGSTGYVTAKPFTIGSGNVYYGDTKTCIRIGKSGSSSSLTIALSATGKVNATSIVVNCNNTGGKNNSDAELNVNSIGAQTTTTTADDYTFTFASATDIENIILTGTASIKIYSITVNYSTGGGGSTCATPTFSPAAGAVAYNSSVSISCATDDATIHYTTNGTDPTSSSATYTSPIAITAATTIKAIAVKDGLTDSEIGTASYTIATPAAPTFNVSSGTIPAGTKVTITGTGTIRYTTNGTDPTSSTGTVYSEPVEINSSCTLKAICVDGGGNESSVTSASYGIVTPVAGYTIDFESVPVAYTDWTMTNIARSTSTISAHGGTYYGTTGGKATASIVTAAKVAKPEALTFYVSRTTTNATSSTWHVEVSSDGSSWNEITTQDATSMTAGSWTKVECDIVDGEDVPYENVYVRIRYAGSTAVRTIDDISLTEVMPVATPTFSVDGGTYTSVQSVTISCATDGATIYYTTDGTDPTSSSTEYTSAVSIDHSCTLKAIAIKGDDESNVASAAYTINLPTEYNLVTSITPGKTYVIASGKADGTVQFMTTQNGSIRDKADGSVDSEVLSATGACEVVIYGPDNDGYYAIYDAAAGGYLSATSNSSNNMGTKTTIDDNARWSITIDGTGVASIVAQGSYSRNTMQYNSSNPRFSCYDGASQNDVYLYEKAGSPVATTASVTLNSKGYATFATTTALDFLDFEDASFSAWQITAANSSTGEITFSQIKEQVAAGTGVFLKGTTGATVNLNVLPAGGNTLTSNKLVGITSATAVAADTYYGLSGNKFVPVNAGTVPAGKALLPASEVSSAREYTFVFEGDETTGVKTIDNGQLTIDNGTVYDLQGRKVTKPVKGGLYIVNGKKVIK